MQGIHTISIKQKPFSFKQCQSEDTIDKISDKVETSRKSFFKADNKNDSDSDTSRSGSARSSPLSRKFFKINRKGSDCGSISSQSSQHSARNSLKQATPKKQQGTRESGILQKILKDLRLSPTNEHAELKQNVDVLCLNEPRPKESKKELKEAKKSNPKPHDLFKELMKPKSSSVMDEPYEKLSDKYGNCESEVIGRGATAKIR